MSASPDLASDLALLHRALELAERGRGRTSPNPIVGAVVARDGAVLGEGFHERAGTPHAEIHALRAAGEGARGATLYVSLEPCAHHGRTPPCVDEILAAGISRVVYPIQDPDPRVAGVGHRRLTETGVEVDRGLLAPEAEAANAEYLHRVRTGRSFVAIKAAVSLDGRLAAEGGDSKWITGEAARARAHRLRAEYDAVLVGRGTADRDDPRLDARLAPGSRDPVAVVVDSKLGARADLALWKRAKEGSQVIVAHLEGASPERALELRGAGVELQEIPADSGGRVHLGSLMTSLAARGLNSVLVEGGAEIHTAILRDSLASRAHVFVAPIVLGGADSTRFVGDLGIRRVADAIRLQDPRVEQLGDDILITGGIAPAGLGHAPVPGESHVHRHRA